MTKQNADNANLADNLMKDANQVGEITKKLMKVTKYETRDYLNGKIIDIDKAVV